MRNHKEDSQNTNHCSSRRQKKYDKEMDHAFQLIFHNIKRLQDGRVYHSASSLDEADMQPEAMALLKVPLHSTLSKSDPSLFNRLTEDDIAQHVELPGTRAKSESFSGTDASPTQRRKVRFADDYAASDTKLKTRPPLGKRSWSDLPPVIVVTEER